MTMHSDVNLFYIYFSVKHIYDKFQILLLDVVTLDMHAKYDNGRMISCFDELQIFDGDDSDSNTLFSGCGSESPMNSEGHIVRIKFTSSRVYSGNGFKLLWGSKY